MLTTLLATVALFLTTPYVGYLDNITVLFLLALMIPFVHEARTSWGARTALFLIGIAAAFTHPTTCVIFGAVLMAVFGFHFLTSRFSFGAALRADAPMLMSVGFGMIAGLAMWVVGIWGEPASLAEAALPPPYTAEFFADRLFEWVGSLQPIVIVPFIVIAIVSTILLSRRTREPARTEDQVSIWWLIAFAGAATVITGAALPYYRFMNASAAPMALVGLGAFVAIRWLLRGPAGPGARRRCARRGARGRLPRARALSTALENRWVSETNQWANQQRADVARGRRRGRRRRRRAAERARRELRRHATTRDRHQHGVRLGEDVHERLPDRASRRRGRALGHLPRHARELPRGRADHADRAAARATTDAAAAHAARRSAGADDLCDPDDKLPDDFVPRFEEFPEEPVVFLIGQYYGGLCNGVDGLLRRRRSSRSSTRRRPRASRSGPTST